MLPPKRCLANSFTRGFSFVGLGALGVSILPNLPGFLATIGALNRENVPALFLSLYHYAWFVGFAVALVVYLAARRLGGCRPLPP